MSCHIQNSAYHKGFSGIVFSDKVGVATAVSQGCTPIGPFRTITKADKHIIQEIDGRNAYEVLKEDLTALASEKTGTSQDELKVKEKTLDRIKSLLKGSASKKDEDKAGKASEAGSQIDSTEDEVPSADTEVSEKDDSSGRRALRRFTERFSWFECQMDMGDGKVLKGDIHVAFSIPGSDKDDDYLVRHALAVDHKNGWIAVADAQKWVSA